MTTRETDSRTAAHGSSAGRGSLLRVEDVSKSFPGVKALSDMHLTLDHGEVLAVIGENGAGKSTLMKLLSGVYTPDTGRFHLEGEEVHFHGPQDALNKGISIIHQEFNLMPDLTVAQNIYIGREPRRAGFVLDHRALNRRTQELLDRLHLPLDPRTLVGSLTVAHQQMVEIAKALSYDAKVLIMDEPTAALNDAEVAALHAIIRRFVSPSTGVIYISHRMNELKAVSDRITIIRDGRYIDTVRTAGSSLSHVISLMVGRELNVDATPEHVDTQAEVVLSVDNLSTKHVLKDVSFELRKGEILGFAGLMGAGRTEVARAVVGADPITGGRITLLGKEVSVPNPAAAASMGIGYLSEDRKQFGLLLNQTVSANVALSALAEKFSRAGFVRDGAIRAEATKQVRNLAVKTPSVRQEVRNLSGGNQQKVVIAKWLTKDCDVLIFDEPTRGIDVGAKEEIYRLLNELIAQGKSIIMISSELPEVLRMSHRVVVMCEGRVTGVLTAQEASQEAIMALATRREDGAPTGIPPSGPSTPQQTVGSP